MLPTSLRLTLPRRRSRPSWLRAKEASWTPTIVMRAAEHTSASKILSLGCSSPVLRCNLDISASWIVCLDGSLHQPWTAL